MVLGKTLKNIDGRELVIKDLRKTVTTRLISDFFTKLYQGELGSIEEGQLVSTIKHVEKSRILQGKV